MKKLMQFTFIIFTAAIYISCGGGEGSDEDKFFAMNNGPVMILDKLNITNQIFDPANTIVVGGLDGSVKTRTEVSIVNLTTLEERTVLSNNRGGFITAIEGSVNDQFRIVSNGVDTTINSVLYIDLNLDTRIALMSGAVNRNLAQLGSAPTTIEIFNDHAYVLNGLSDNIQIFDITHNPPVQTGVIALPLNSDPLGIAFLDDTHAYVSNTINENLAIINLEDESCEAVISQIEGDFTPCDDLILVNEGSFVNPAGIAITNGKVYVANQNLDANFSPIGKGFVTVIDTDTNQVETIIDATGEGTSGTGSGINIINDKLYLVNSGNVLFDFDNGTFACDPESPISIDIINITTDTLEDSIEFPLSNINPFVCAPEVITAGPDNEFAYLGSQLAGVLFKIDLDTNTLLRGAGNPIIITNVDELDSTSDIAFNSSGYGFISLFNTDRVFAFDPEIDAVSPYPFIAEFPVGLRGDNPTSNLFDGPQAFAIADNGIDPDLFFITGISEKLGSINTTLFTPGNEE